MKRRESIPKPDLQLTSTHRQIHWHIIPARYWNATYKPMCFIVEPVFHHHHRCHWTGDTCPRSTAPTVHSVPTTPAKSSSWKHLHSSKSDLRATSDDLRRMRHLPRCHDIEHCRRVWICADGDVAVGWRLTTSTCMCQLGGLLGGWRRTLGCVGTPSQCFQYCCHHRRRRRRHCPQHW